MLSLCKNIECNILLSIDKKYYVIMNISSYCGRYPH